MGERHLEPYRCANCGGTVKWNITKKRMECAACRTPYEPEGGGRQIQKHAYESLAEDEKRLILFPELTVMRCSGCGAELTFDSDDTAKVCPLCGSSNVWGGRQSVGIPPDGIIPFQIDRAEAQRLFRKWVKGLRFAPGGLKKTFQEGRLQGMYVPFWAFDAQASAFYQGRGGRERKVRDRNGKVRTVVDWERADGTVSQKFSDIQIPAASGDVREVLGMVLPYHTEKYTVPFAPIYLSGFSAERYTVSVSDGLESAKGKMESELRQRAKTQIRRRGYDRAQIDSLQMTLDRTMYQHLLFPAWCSSYVYGGERYLYVINGETGRVGGKRPYSIPKIAAAVVLILLLLWGIFGDAKTDAAPMDGMAAVQAEQSGQDDACGTDIKTAFLERGL